MSSKTLMTVQDEAERLRLAHLSARVLTFSDGLSRHITLTARQWADLDALLEDGWSQEQLLWVPFDMAVELSAVGGTDFEEELRACIQTTANGAWVYHSDHKKQRPAN